MSLLSLSRPLGALLHLLKPCTPFYCSLHSIFAILSASCCILIVSVIGEEVFGEVNLHTKLSFILAPLGVCFLASRSLRYRYLTRKSSTACDTSEAAVTRASQSVYQDLNTAKRIVARHLECSLSVLESKRSLVGKLTYFIYS